MPDPVNHPPHYTQHPGGIECADVIGSMEVWRGNAIKYLWRAGRKDSESTDLRKALWWINWRLRQIEGRPPV